MFLFFCSFPSRGKFLGKVNACRVRPPGCTFVKIFHKTTVMTCVRLNVYESIALSLKGLRSRIDSPLRPKGILGKFSHLSIGCWGYFTGDVAVRAWCWPLTSTSTESQTSCFRVIVVPWRCLPRGGPNLAVNWLALLLRVREVPSSNLLPEAGCLDWGFSCRDSTFKWVTTSSFHISAVYYSLIILSFDAV
jgi:hypothetical protein